MFYVCKKRDDGKFGVMDTTDGVVEYYTPQEVIKFITKLHVDIKGVHRWDNGKFGISVLKPTNFKTEGTEVLNLNGVPLDSFSPEYYRIKYKDLSEKEVTQLARDTFIKLCNVIHTLTFKDYSNRTLQLLDGLDCIGFHSIDVDAIYSISIYFNPDIQANLIVSTGFGFDLYRDGKMVEDGHFDSSFSDWKTDLTKYKYKEVFDSLRH